MNCKGCLPGCSRHLLRILLIPPMTWASLFVMLNMRMMRRWRQKKALEGGKFTSAAALQHPWCCRAVVQLCICFDMIRW